MLIKGIRYNYKTLILFITSNTLKKSLAVPASQDDLLLIKTNKKTEINKRVRSQRPGSGFGVTKTRPLKRSYEV